MPTTNNNFFVYIGDNWEQINPDFTNEIEYLQQLITILNGKIDRLTDNVESLNNYDDIKLKIRTLLQDKLKYYLYNYNLPSNVYDLAKLYSMIAYKDNNGTGKCTYYIDNRNGSDTNDGLSIFSPRKTLPSTLDETKALNGAIGVRLIDSPIPYDLSELARDISDPYIFLIFQGNHKDPSQVQLQNSTYAEFNMQGSMLAFFDLTIHNSLYIQKEGDIGFYNCNIDSNIYIEPISDSNTIYLEKSDITLEDYYGSTEFNSIVPYFQSTNDTLTFASQLGMANMSALTYRLDYIDIEPTNNTDINNLDDLTSYIQYLQKILNSESVNTTELINEIEPITISIDNNKRLIVSNTISNSNTKAYSILTAPLKIYDYNTNELLVNTNDWNNYYSLSSNISLDTPKNLKITISNIFEILYENSVKTTTTVANFRTALNNNKINGTNLPANTNVYATSYSNGGEYKYTLPSNFSLTVKNSHYTITNTGTAEYRFGYDNTDTDPQHYIQMLMTEDTITFNDINNGTTTQLHQFTLPSDTTNTTNITYTITYRTNGLLNIEFNGEKYNTVLTSPLSCSDWYINIPSNATSLRTIAQGGIEVTEYPNPII